MSLILDLVSLLETAAVGTFGDDIFVGFTDKAGAPDTQLALYETPGMAPEHVLGNNPPSAIRPRVQIAARATDYVDARALAQAAYDAVGNLTGVTVGGTLYVRIEALQEPHDIGPDLSNRRVLAFNLQITRSP